VRDCQDPSHGIDLDLGPEMEVTSADLGGSLRPNLKARRPPAGRRAIKQGKPVHLQHHDGQGPTPGPGPLQCAGQAGPSPPSGGTRRGGPP
jgi:hypothetical protein